MKIDLNLEPQDVECIAQRVSELLKPFLSSRQEKNSEVIFDVDGLAEYLKASPAWIYQQTSLKQIPHFKIGGLLRFKKSKIDKWLAASEFSAVSRRLKAIK